VSAINGPQYLIVVVSKDISFQNRMQFVFAGLAPGGRTLAARSVHELQNKLTKAVPAVILLDVDSEELPENYIAQLNTIYRLLVITTGVSPAPPPSVKTRAPDYVQKTRPPLPETAFLNACRIKINAFVTSCAPLNLRDAFSATNKNQKIIAIASSTGGTEALEAIFLKLDQNAPPIIVVQHMPSGFTKLFADRLNGLCRVHVKEAQQNDGLRAGQVLIAPAGRHTAVTMSGGMLVADCFDGPKLHGVIPAADHLFNSVASLKKGNAIGVILTGMGSDGARGLVNMHNHGAKTIGQDQKTSVVYGMPKAAFDLGAVDYQLPLHSIADKMLALAR